jgi:hypothetical protein
VKKLGASVGLIAMAFVAATATAQSSSTKLNGEVVAANGSSFQLRTTAGERFEIKVSDRARLTERSAIEIGVIREGVYLGTTATPQADGTLLASEVHVFSEAMRGTGEGHRPVPNDPSSTMTNATVANVSAPKTTSATVSSVAASSTREHGLRMTLRYAGGEKTVVVPDGVPIVMMEMGDRAMLVPGAHVVAYVTRQPDGKLLAERVSIGKAGYVPLQ